MDLKLDVVRLANEDVIATSGICLDFAEPHILYTKNDGTPDNNPIYLYSSSTGKWVYNGDMNDSACATANINENGWWHAQEAVGGGSVTWVKCDEQSDGSHPVPKN